MVGKVSRDTRAVVRVPTLKGVELPAKVARLAGALDSRSRTLRVELDLPNPDGKLLPGMIVTVSVVPDK